VGLPCEVVLIGRSLELLSQTMLMLMIPSICLQNVSFREGNHLRLYAGVRSLSVNTWTGGKFLQAKC
jgi:hypothetical protein